MTELVDRYRRALDQVWDWQDRTLELILLPFGLQPQHYLILLHIVNEGQRERSDLAARSMRTQGTVTRAIQALKQKKLVTTKRQPEDKRRVDVFPTEVGAETCHKIEEARSEAVRSMIGEIPTKQRAELAKALTVLSNFVPDGRFESLVPPPGSAGNCQKLMMPEDVKE